MGAALVTDSDLYFRNLGGTGQQRAAIGPRIGTLTSTVTATKVVRSGDLIIQNFRFSVASQGQALYEGETEFGFFTREALSKQVGIRGAQWPDLREGQRLTQPLPYPDGPGLAKAPLLMIDAVTGLDLRGGAAGLGLIEGIKAVNPQEWFFDAHFYGDPVMPGSLGLEACLQLFRVLVREKYGEGALGSWQVPEKDTAHRWLYRGQVLQQNKEVIVRVEVERMDRASGLVFGRGTLRCDGIVIYQFEGMELRVIRPH
jgi:3-hydroxymyristoyl/3-hydroxydecanoyl-(acyl carrier protein) dehydratase